MLVVLDTTVLIDYLRGRPAVSRVAELRAAGDLAATTAINVEEIVRGLREDETSGAERLFEGLIVLAPEIRSAWLTGTWRREYAARGVTLWQADCLIAATAKVHGARLVTGNPKDFPMPGVDVAHWPVGS